MAVCTIGCCKWQSEAMTSPCRAVFYLRKKVALCRLINRNLKAMAVSEEGRMEEECGSKSGVCLNWLKGVKTQSGDLSVTDICTQY